MTYLDLMNSQRPGRLCFATTGTPKHSDSPTSSATRTRSPRSASAGNMAFAPSSFGWIGTKKTRFLDFGTTEFTERSTSFPSALGTWDPETRIHRLALLRVLMRIRSAVCCLLSQGELAVSRRDFELHPRTRRPSTSR